MSTITVKELLEELDGAGIIIEDPELMEEEIENLGLTNDSEILQSFEESETPIIVDEDTIIRVMQEWSVDTDADTLAENVGRIFGGKCYFTNGQYEFYKNSSYMGAFEQENYKHGYNQSIQRNS